MTLAGLGALTAASLLPQPGEDSNVSSKLRLPVVVADHENPPLEVPDIAPLVRPVDDSFEIMGAIDF